MPKVNDFVRMYVACVVSSTWGHPALELLWLLTHQPLEGWGWGLASVLPVTPTARLSPPPMTEANIQ